MTQAGGWRLELKKFFSEFHFTSSSRKKIQRNFFPKMTEKIKLSWRKNGETTHCLDIYTPAAWGFGTLEDFGMGLHRNLGTWGLG